VLTGRIRFVNGHLIVSAELINTADGSQMWGSQYRRARSDILAVQEIISNDIVEHLRLKLDSSHKRPAANPAAYDLYLQGRFFLNKMTLDGVRKAFDLFTQAIGKDPDYAPAHAGLIDCHMKMNDPIEAKKAAVKAFELDPTLGEARASLGFLTFIYDWDWSKAEFELRRAIELNPNYAQARQWYALYLAKMGRHEEAVAEAREAQRLDPVSLPMNLTTALVLCFARRYDQSIREIKRVIEMDAHFAAAHSTLGLAYAYRKMCNEAIAAFRIASALAGNSPEMNIHFDTLTAYSYAASGKTKQARSFLNAITKQPGTSPYALGMIHAQLGERSLALDWLERAYRERNYQMVWLKVDPALDPLRRTRRFKDLLTRIGLT
jgi:tetratricopeptide (TPR) repeat protein